MTVLSDERRRIAAQLRSDKLTWAAIGKILGVSSSRAMQLARSAERMKLFPFEPGHSLHELDGLSTRVRNTLKCEGYETRQQVIEDLNSNRLAPDCKTTNYGIKAHEEVCAWAGVQIKNRHERTIENYIKFLKKHGYKVTGGRK
jgi:hypothetical protein